MYSFRNKDTIMSSGASEHASAADAGGVCECVSEKHDLHERRDMSDMNDMYISLSSPIVMHR